MIDFLLTVTNEQQIMQNNLKFLRFSTVCTGVGAEK